MSATITMTAKSYISQAEIDHVLADPKVDEESKLALAEGHITRFASLRPFTDLIASLNRWAAENVTTSIEWMNKELASELLGLHEVQPKMVPKMKDGAPVVNAETGEPVMTPQPQPYLFSVKTSSDGTLRFGTSNNKTNRNHDPKVSDAFRDQVLAACAVLNGEGWIIDSTGQAISLQHRAIGGIKAYYDNPDSPSFPVLIVRNVPALFADTADTGRSRTTADILVRDESVLRLETLVDSGGNLLGEKATGVRVKLSKDLQGVLRLLNLRLQGKNVNTSLKLRDGGYNLYSHFCNLDQLVNMVANEGETTHGTQEAAIGIRKTLGKSALAAAIVLSEMTEHQPIMDNDGIPVADDCTVDIDLEAWTHRLRVLNSECASQEGELFNAMRQIRDANKNSKQKPVDKFASVCFVVSMLADTPLEDWKSKSDVSFALPGIRGKKDKHYPHFGGADLGYVGKATVSE